MHDAAETPDNPAARLPLIAIPWARLRQAHAALSRRPFLKNVSIMLTGAAAGQCVSVALAPVLTRIYSPQQFGVLRVYTAVLSILVVRGSLRYELTLPLANSEEDAINLVAVCGCTLLGMTTLIGILAFAVPESLVKDIWPTPIYWLRVNVYCGLLVLGFFCLGAYYIALYLATRQGAFRAIARTRVNQGVAGPLTQIGLGLGGAGAPGLVIGSILGQSVGTFGLVYRVLNERRQLLRGISWQRMRALAWRYRRFPMIASWAALIDTAGGNQLLFLMVSTVYSARIAGFIFLADRVVARPLTLIGTSILQVFVGEAGRTASSDPAKLQARFYQVTSRQFLLAAVWILLCNVAATALFPTIFGADWSDAVIYLRAMSIGYLAQLVVMPVFHTLQILEKQALAAAWQLGRLLLILSVFAVSIHENLTAPWAVFSYSAAQALSSALLFAIMAREIQRLQR
jgi:O-antigen/teichoic acid export membrane protein